MSDTKYTTREKVRNTIEAAIGDRLLGNRPLSRGYAFAVVDEINVAIESLLKDAVAKTWEEAADIVRGFQPGQNIDEYFRNRSKAAREGK